MRYLIAEEWKQPSIKGTRRTLLSPWTVVITSSIVVHRVVDLAANGWVYVIVCLSPSHWRIACTEAYRAVCSISCRLHGHCYYDMQSLTHGSLKLLISQVAPAPRPAHVCCLFGITWCGLEVLYMFIAFIS